MTTATEKNKATGEAKKTRKQNTSRRRYTSKHKDPATHYAEKVDAGRIVAGPHVRAACRRHLRDLKNGPKRGLTWDLDAAMHAIGFFRDVLRLNGGEHEGLPFELELWQAFIVGSLFGWKDRDGYRRFRVAYVETGKGSGKSPLAAGIGLYGLCADGENRAEIYAAATKRDQAQILFNDAVAMVKLQPMLGRRIRISGTAGNEHNLLYEDTHSFFRPIAAGEGQSGPRPHMGLLDEIHEHDDGRVVEMLRAGTKSRRQALMFMITNSGANRQSVCYEYHDYGAQVSAGSLEDDTMFSYICGLDEGDDPFHDERCWIKANPSLGVTIDRKYLREQVREARGMPSKESIVRRLNFCEWVDAKNPWLSFDAWESARDDYTLDDMRGRRCIAGLDLSSTTDLTALVLAFEPTAEDPYWRLLPFFWLPEEGLAEKEKKDHAPYTSWYRNGFLEVTPGQAVSRRYVLQRIGQIAPEVEIRLLAYDRWRIEDLKQEALDEGIDLPPMEPFGQGYKDMSPAVENFETMLLNGELKHNANPVMRWCAANAVTTEDAAGNRKLDKTKATGRIDGIVAALMATGSINTETTGPSVYETRGVLEIEL